MTTSRSSHTYGVRPDGSTEWHAPPEKPISIQIYRDHNLLEDMKEGGRRFTNSLVHELSHAVGRTTREQGSSQWVNPLTEDPYLGPTADRSKARSALNLRDSYAIGGFVSSALSGSVQKDHGYFARSSRALYEKRVSDREGD